MTRTKPVPLDILSLEDVEGVGPKLAEVLNGMNISFVADLLEHYPHRYLDLGTVKKIGSIREGEEVTVVGKVMDVQKRAARRGRMTILSVAVFDGTGYISAIWFNQNYIANKLVIGTTVALSGKVIRRFNQLQMTSPFYDIVGEPGSKNTGRIIPVHPATARLSTSRFRRLISNALKQYSHDIIETLPGNIREKYSLLGLKDALCQIHFPESIEKLKRARERLIFDELFRLQLGLSLRRRYMTLGVIGIEHKIKGRLLNDFYADLPWSLTSCQQTALLDIRRDMESPRPMHRLLLGEVGSGKTVVAAAAMLMSVGGGRQAVIMAPTEVLAEQHYRKLSGPFEALGLKSALILGSQTGSKKKAALELVAQGRVDIVIGTHAVIQEKVDFSRLGLVVIDEQHRFGVRQRLDLRAKGNNADMLVLTATPIPRTLALTLYGDLDISMLTVRPGGKSVADQIETKYIKESRRDQAYQLIRREAAAGRQAYIVCPLIDESDKLEVKSVLREAEHLKTKVFPDLKVGILHGRLSSDEKEAAMRAFRDGLLDILIATTVIEVGVDVPKATVMMIEHAERFGLSQLHQLRGRVGRGSWSSYCLLLGDVKTEEARARIKAVLTTFDGFKLAEADLKIRGEGQLFGLRQSGLPDLKLAKLATHTQVLELARREALALVEKDPVLKDPEHRPLKAELKRRFAGNLDWLMSG